MIKRMMDILGSLFGLVLLSPVLLPVMFLVWKQDRCSPFYVAPRTGLNGKQFTMVKLRSMVVNADKTGVDSTGSNDMRITPIGKLIRKYKLDELTQLWNVLIGDMSLVGPRPNVKRETDLYTDIETRLLSVKPGVTDISSIVFSDEGDILKDKCDPDIAYNQLIRPGKSYLGLFYIDKRSIWLDLKLCGVTICAIFSREAALQILNKIMVSLGANDFLIDIALRKASLVPMPPPGSDVIVNQR